MRGTGAYAAWASALEFERSADRVQWRRRRIEKCEHVHQIARTAHRRQALPDPATVWLIGEPRIADHQHAAIGLGADQSTRALFQADRGLRKLPIEKRIAAVGLQLVESCCEQWIVRRRERQLVDDDERQRVTGDLDAFPEACAAKQDGVAERGKTRE